LFAFQGAVADPLPREKARIELVVRLQEQVAPENDLPIRQDFIVSKTLSKAQVEHPRFHFLIISCLQHHSSL
jgi:hypothetical protein